MSKYSTKIFRIDQSHFVSERPQVFITFLIRNHNEKGNNIYTEVQCTEQGEVFNQMLFIHKAQPSYPSWKNMLLEITSSAQDIKDIQSKYPSFLLFFYSSTEAYVISGGAGYRVIESALDSHFGFSVVERLIDTSKDDIRGLSQRVFLGVELASNRYFKADYVFDDEDNFGKYYRGLDVFIDSDKLKDIGIETSKKKLLVKGEQGFKIDTKISFGELVERIEKISGLINDPNPPEIELNPFKKLNRWELKRTYGRRGTMQEILDKKLANQYFDSFQAKEVKDIYHPVLFEYLQCSTIRIKIGRNPHVDISTDQVITPRLIIGYLIDSNALGLDIERIYFPKFLELCQEIRIWIVDEERDLALYESVLLDWFFGEVELDGKYYMKFENDWFNYSIRFSNDLDSRLDSFADRITLETMQRWTTDYSREGGYNDSFAGVQNFIVADGRFHSWIEVADLFSWNEQELIVYHVKDGLSRDLRVLQSQITNSAKVIAQFRSDPNSSDVSSYHSKLVEQANKLGYTIPDLDEFKEILQRPNVRFVFAFATDSENLEKHDIIEEIKGSDSAVAKIAVLHSFYTIRQLDFHFSIAKIIREVALNLVG